MSIAELHGKISSSGTNLSDRLEDLLTADIFGPLRYLPFQDGLSHILIQAMNYHDHSFFSVVPGIRDIAPTFRFWPKLGRSEPDLIIEYGSDLIMFEVKYLSGKSGHFVTTESEEDNQRAASSDQLGREYLDLLDYAGDFRKRSLIYVTSHKSLPWDDLNAGREAIKTLNTFPESSWQGYEANTYWLSWHGVREAVSASIPRLNNFYQKCILGDIEALLRRKGFRSFEGFQELNLKPISSRGNRIFYKKSLRRYFENEYMEVWTKPSTIYFSRQDCEPGV